MKSLFAWALLPLFCLLVACDNTAPATTAPESKQPDNPAPTAAPADNAGDESATSVADKTPVIEKDEELIAEAPKTTVPRPATKTAPPPRTATIPEEEKIADFTDITALDPGIRLDIRYASTNNFTKAQIYDCPRCLLRPAAATAIAKAHKALIAQGYGGFKMFDCYRPRPYQQRLWDKVPNPDYVTPPAKGSMHSRGAAVDLTIVDKNGKELDMGTEYDFFGEQAHYDYTRLPAAVLANRRLLRSTLEAVGFQGIRTEWWHFSFRGKEYPLSDVVWKCR